MLKKNQVKSNMLMKNQAKSFYMLQKDQDKLKLSLEYDYNTITIQLEVAEPTARGTRASPPFGVAHPNQAP